MLEAQELQADLAKTALPRKLASTPGSPTPPAFGMADWLSRRHKCKTPWAVVLVDICSRSEPERGR